MCYLGGSASGCGSAGQGSGLQAQFGLVSCAMLVVQAEEAAPPEACSPHGGHWMEKAGHASTLKTSLFMVRPLTWQWSKQVAGSRSTSMGQGCIPPTVGRGRK